MSFLRRVSNSRMIKILAVSVSACALSACGDRTPCPQTLLTHKGCQEISKGLGYVIEGKESNPQLKKIFYDFRDDADFYGLALPEERNLYVLKFDGSLPQGYLGLCRRKKINTLENNRLEVRMMIFISPRLRDDPYKLKRTVYHELGHCYFDREHDETQGSIMYKGTPLQSSVLRDRWDLLVHNFFAEM